MIEVRKNEALSGIEVVFDEKPDDAKPISRPQFIFSQTQA